MAVQPNISGMGRLIYLAVALAILGWAIWGDGADWMKYTALAVGGAVCVLAIIGYSPLHAIFGEKRQKAG